MLKESEVKSAAYNELCRDLNRIISATKSPQTFSEEYETIVSGIVPGFQERLSLYESQSYEVIKKEIKNAVLSSDKLKEIAAETKTKLENKEKPKDDIPNINIGNLKKLSDVKLEEFDVEEINDLYLNIPTDNTLAEKKVYASNRNRMISYFQNYLKELEKFELRLCRVRENNIKLLSEIIPVLCDAHYGEVWKICNNLQSLENTKKVQSFEFKPKISEFLQNVIIVLTQD